MSAEINGPIHTERLAENFTTVTASKHVIHCAVSVTSELKTLGEKQLPCHIKKQLLFLKHVARM